MTSSQAGAVTGPRTLGWAPGLGTAVCLLITLVFATYLFTPVWWPEIGADAKVLYAAGVLSAAGGDPYDIAQQGAEEDRLYNQAGGSRPFSHAAYGYPPLVTAFLRVGARASEPAFYLAGLALLLGAGLAGLEMVLAMLHRQRRWLARAFFLASAPMALDLFVGNPSALLLLFCAGGGWLVARGRPVLGGLVLAGVTLKPQVGLPVAAAVIATAPLAHAAGAITRLKMSLKAAEGLAAGTALVVVAGELMVGHGSLGAWLRAAQGFGRALGPGSAPSAFSQNALAGLPALLMARLSAPAAVALTALVVLPTVGFTLWRHRDRVTLPSYGPLAAGISLALALSPYLHLNDLVLGALPVLVVAASPLDRTTRFTLLVWSIGPYVALVFLAIAIPLLGLTAFGQVGFGVVLTSSLLVAATRVMLEPATA